MAHPFVTALRVLTVALVLIAGILLFVSTEYASRLVSEQIVTKLAQASGRQVKLEKVELNIFPPGITLEALALSDRDGSFEEPVVEVDQASATVAPFSILRGSIRIDTVDVDGVRVRWKRAPAGTAASGVGPRRRSRLARSLVLSRVNARNATVIYEGGEERFNFEAADMRVSASSAPCDDPVCLDGLAAAGRFRFAFRDHALSGDGISVSFQSRAHGITIPRFSITSPSASAAGHANWRFGSPGSGLAAGSISAAGPDLAGLLGEIPIDAGSLEMDATVTFNEGQAAITGRGHVERIRYGSHARARRAEGSFTYRDGKLTSRIDATGVIPTITGLPEPSPGSLTGQITVNPDRSALASLETTGLGYRDLLAGIDGRFPVADLDVEGNGDLTWTVGRAGSFQGQVEIRFQPLPPPAGVVPGPGRPRVALGGSTRMEVDTERVRFVDGTVIGSGVEATLDGEIVPGAGRARIDIGITRADLSPLLEALRRIPATEMAREQMLRGAASGEMALIWEPGRFRTTGAAHGAGLQIMVGPDQVGPFIAAAAWESEGSSLDINSLDLRGADWSGNLSLTSRTDMPWPVRRLDAQFRDLPAQIIWNAAGTEHLSGGRLSGRTAMDLDGDELAPGEGEFHLTATGTTIAGIPSRTLSAHGVGGPAGFHFWEITADTEAGPVRAEGHMNPDTGTGRFDLASDALDAARLVAGTALEDRVTGSLAFTGIAETGPDGILFTADVRGEAMTLDRIELGTVHSERFVYDGTAGGRLEIPVVAESMGAKGSLTLAGAEATDLDVDLAFDGLDLALLRPLLPEGMMSGLTARAGGTLTGTLNTSDPFHSDLRGEVISLTAIAEGMEFSSASRADLVLTGSRLRLTPLKLKGRETDLEVEGSLGLGDVKGGSVDVVGLLNLRLLEQFVPDLQSRGVARTDIHGQLGDEGFTFTGRIAVQGASLNYPGSPSPADNLALNAHADAEGNLTIEALSFEFAGGQVTGEGEGRLDGVSLPRCQLRLNGSSLHARPIDDLEIFFDARAQLNIREEGAQLAGRLDVLRATYSREFGLEGTTRIRRGRATVNGPALDAGPSLGLDLDIVAPSEVWVRNQSARLEGAARLRVTGTLDRPELTGRITVLDGGTFRFRDVTYRSEGGGLDFDDPDLIDPLMDVRANTNVQEYEITLHILGRFSSPRFELTSEPALPPRDIVSLLVTGDLYGDSLGAETGATLLAEENVAQYLTAPISETLGRTVGKALNLTSVQLQPQFLNGRADPTARLTLTKRLSPKVLFTYSNNLGSSQEQIYQFEYDLSRSWQLVGTRDFDSSVSSNLTFRHRWGGPERTRSAARTLSPFEARGAEVNRILLEGSPPDEERGLRRRIQVKSGKKYVRADALESRERVRSHLSQEGYPMASVRLEEAEAADDAAEGIEAVDLLYKVDPGAPVTLHIDGVKREKPLRRAVWQAWELPLLKAELAPTGEKAIREALSEKGYATATIDTQTRDRNDIYRVRYTIDRGPKVSIGQLDFRGTPSIPEKEIRGVMESREDRWNTTGLLRVTELEADLQAIRALYQSKGYLDVEVPEPSITFSEDRETAEIEIAIQEGPVWRAGEVSIEGAEGYPVRSLLEATRIEPGMVLKPSLIQEAGDRIRDLLDANGYNKAKVRHLLEGPPGSARLLYEVEEGPRQVLTDVEIRGTELTAKRIVRREISLEPGDPISRTELLEIQRRLYSLGIFRTVDVRAVETGEEGNAAIRVDVEEGDPLLTSVGVGYDSHERLQGFGQIGHNNVFGTGRSVSLLLRGSALSRRAQLSLADRRLFGIPFEGIATASYEEQERDSFDVRRNSLGVQFRRKLTRELTLLGRYSLQDVDLLRVEPNFIPGSDIADEAIRLGSAGGSIARDTRDDILSPRRGTFLTADVRLYAEFLGSTERFSRLFLTGSAFRSIGREVVLAVSARAGLANPLLSTTTIPLSERFFAGGDTTLRGFKVDQAGPLDPATLEPIGGEFTLIFNTEIRFPVWRALKGVVFYDAGNSFLTPGDFDPSRTSLILDDATGLPLGIQDGIRHVLGAGIRFDTPLGPFRLEYGRKLDRFYGRFDFDDGNGGMLSIFRDESPYEIFLSIGQAF